MFDNHKVAVLSDNKEWSVYLCIEELCKLESSETCCSCSSVCDDLFKATIVEMYDENGVDVAPSSKVYRFAKKALDADGQPHPYCIECRLSVEIYFDQ